MKCLYCGKEIPEKKEDSLGKKLTKKVKFCRGTDCYRKWWNKKKKAHIKEYHRKKYLRLKKEGYYNKKVDKK